ncbi:MAG: hypothetical protein HOI66_08855 [Verrucomicrobia bacterium]|nr:hypothetical protein [Verrucomicrobiota bacterium]MDA7645407.1 hypothetical protein [bacterium]
MKKIPVFLTLASVLKALNVGQAQPAVVTPEVSISQEILLKQGTINGGYSLTKVLESGGQFFSTAYTPTDGMGEGDSGPKSEQRKDFFPQTLLPVLKMNGLGANSCFDCHNSIGSYVPPNSKTGALIRKPSTVGGGGGLASNLFQNPDFPDQIVKFYRNPPHVFGTGYTQRIATEITHDLQLAKSAAELAAKLNPGQAQSIELFSKENNYGTYQVTYNAQTDSFTEDTSQVTRVPNDLVVRPFQHKGIASSLRHFVMSALDFHFSVQPVEVVGYNVDLDADGKFNEMSFNLNEEPASADGSPSEATDVSFGNVSALTAFVGMTRPPEVEIPEGKEDEFARGQSVFNGTGLSGLPESATQMCATCHRETMRAELPYFTIDTPTIQGDLSYRSQAGLGDSTVPSSDALPVTMGFAEILQEYLSDPLLLDAVNNPENAASDFQELLLQVAQSNERMFLPPGYHINLTQPNSNDLDSELEDLPPYIFPRLSPNSDGSIDVPFMSDLMLHDMGEGLTDVEDQEVDVNGVFVERRHYLTRPLWGVADSGPWMHDGRAFDLRSAIMWHKSDGSEANDVVTAYESLSESDQQALLTFLESHRLGIEQQEPTLLYQGDSGIQAMGIRNIRQSNGRVTIQFEGTLHTSDSSVGPYVPIPDSNSPYTFTPEKRNAFFIAR